MIGRYTFRLPFNLQIQGPNVQPMRSTLLLRHSLEAFAYAIPCSKKKPLFLGCGSHRHAGFRLLRFCLRCYDGLEWVWFGVVRLVWFALSVPSHVLHGWTRGPLLPPMVMAVLLFSVSTPVGWEY